MFKKCIKSSKESLYFDLKANSVEYFVFLFQVKELREQLHKRRMKTSQASERYETLFRNCRCHVILHFYLS